MDTSLPSSLRSLLASGHLSKHSVESRPSLLVLRHSDRPVLPPRSAGGELFLTDAGKARARQLGACLHAVGITPGAVLMTTPMTRTAQTLLSICAGAGWHDRLESIQVSVRAFGIGTIFDRTFNMDDVMSQYTGSGGHQAAVCHAFNAVSSGRVQVPGVKPCDQAACAQLRFFKSLVDKQKQHPTEPKGLSILLAHDLNLAFLLAHYFNVKEFTPDTWPPFLDGVLIQSGVGEEEDKLRVIYGDKMIEVDMPNEA